MEDKIKTLKFFQDPPNPMDLEILSDIGLTNAEIKVYLALLELGSSTAGPILEKSGLQNSVVHMTLNRLIEKGLVSFVKEGKRNHYQAADPKHIIEFIDQKKERFEKLLPTLLEKQKLSKQKTDVTTFRGTRGIKELLTILLNAGGKEHHVFGRIKESIRVVPGEWWKIYHQKRTDKGIKAKLLFNESLREWTEIANLPGSKIRFTKKGFEPLTETIIRNDKIGIIFWIVEKPMGILIHNRIAAKSYDQFFNLLWKQAK